MGLDLVVQIGEPRYDKDLMDKMDRYRRDYDWIKDNHSALLEKHPRQYIAVRDRGVQYHGGSMKELLDQMLERDENPSEFTVEFMTDEETAFIFYEFMTDEETAFIF